MRIANVDGQRREPQPNLTGQCPGCDQPVIAKCGRIRVWHWAHRPGAACVDHWWEYETDWHRAWKSRFPVSWQEIVHRAESGERHIADVKTGDGWVLEFQHSPIDAEERAARDSFYPKLVWVVDGIARKRDATQFRQAWDEGSPIGANSPVRRVCLDGCARLKEWAGSRAHVLFDFGDEATLWWLPPVRHRNGDVYVAKHPSKDEFVGSHRPDGGEPTVRFEQLAQHLVRFIDQCETPRQPQRSVAVPRQFNARPRVRMAPIEAILQKQERRTARPRKRATARNRRHARRRRRR